MSKQITKEVWCWIPISLLTIFLEWSGIVEIKNEVRGVPALSDLYLRFYLDHSS